MTIFAKPLTGPAFAPFGRIAGAEGASVTINEGRGSRLDLARFTAGEGSIVVVASELAASSWPVTVRVFERHPRSEQLFVPLPGSNALVVVAPTRPEDGEPDLARIEAFLAGPETPFVYRAGVWHAPLFAIGCPGRFLMSVRERGQPDDCELTSCLPQTVIPPSDDDGIT